MTRTKEFNPIHAAQIIEESYREYIATTIHFDDADLQEQLEQILKEPRYLAKGPYLQAAPPYKKDKSVADLVDEGVLCAGMLKLGGGDPAKFDMNRPLYVHQVRAIRKAAADRNYAVVTGTGSGKTESFLLPIVNDILAEFEAEGPSSGVRAMILYPMNALANDQLKRLRTLLEGTGITFGRYTGDTEEKPDKAKEKWRDENPGQTKLENEVISREEIRENPPNILLTNYSMLEYLLLRPADAPLFGSVFGSKWRHIAIDEAHVYSGALGTEIAYLIRRLKARIESETGVSIAPHCYATSATIGTKDDMPKVARFAQDLFGEPFCDDPDNDLDVITSEVDSPEQALDFEPWGTLALPAWAQLRKACASHEDVDAGKIIGILRDAGVSDAVVKRMEGKPALLGLGAILLGETSTVTLVRANKGLIDLTDRSQIDDLGIEGLHGDEKGIAILSAMVEVLSAAERSQDVPLLSSRYHSFLRAPEGLYINLLTRKLTQCKTISVSDDNGNPIPVYEVSVCRHCGQAYVLGNEKSNADAGTAWLNPVHDGTNLGDEFLPRKYYRLLPSEKDCDNEETLQWLCPACGSLHNERQGGGHLFSHGPVDRVPVALNEREDRQSEEGSAQCRHCGYQSARAIRPMRVAPESAGNVVCYDLVREIPPFDEVDDEFGADDFFGFDELDDGELRAGNVVCFSDRRQDAAYFAPAMERTYGNIVRRQLIREVVDVCGQDRVCSASAVVNGLVDLSERKYGDLLGQDPKSVATAWLLDEMAAEDSRNSLEGLGVVRIEPTAFIDGFDDDGVRGAVRKDLDRLRNAGVDWVTAEDYALLARMCLESLREQNAIEVPMGVSGKRTNHDKKGKYVVLDGVSSKSSGVIRFAGSDMGAPENKRSMFVRKYAHHVYDLEIGREGAQVVLQSLFGFLARYLGGYFKRKKYLSEDSTRDKFRLSKDIWRFYPHTDGDVVYRCDACGCETHIDTHGVCLTAKCDGQMRETTFAAAHNKDRYYKTVYQEDALPISIKEHTAQLSSEEARRVQSDFIKGKVNILSCTTTFELGVDVGDLRAIFMRNVPPTAANYAQRAGRVGRRAGMPGYAVTFARLRPHDLSYFAAPERILDGDTRVPVCYLDNTAIAARHVYAVALSEFFRLHGNASGKDYAKYYNDFMDLAADEPQGLVELREFLESRPDSLGRQLLRAIPEGSTAFSELRIDTWEWVSDLVGTSGENAKGRLRLAHALKRDDYERIEKGIEANRGSNGYLAGKLMQSEASLKCEQTIGVLAENGILPKYGFPTDLVTLRLPAEERAVGGSALNLSRGLRQAIREYAPGNEVVAGGRLWRSVSITRPRERNLTVRRFGKCPKCGTFVWPIENYDATGECPACGAKIELKSKVLIPSSGFEAVQVSERAGVRKPQVRGYVQIYFSQHWPDEVDVAVAAFAGGKVQSKYAGNAQLCALNAPGEGFYVCDYCNAAAVGKKVPHQKWCVHDLRPTRYDALGAAFVSDVLELAISVPSLETDEEDWESVLWALFAAAAQLLEIPETELGGTSYRNREGGMSVMIYDDVPGGAGHAKQLSEQIPELIERAYHVVDGHCGCGDDTCCYGCIANYYNQPRQASLSRGAAKRILGALLGKDPNDVPGAAGEVPSSGARVAEHAVAATVAVPSVSVFSGAPITLLTLKVVDEGASLEALPFAKACKCAISSQASDAWRSLVSEISKLGEACENLENPRVDIELTDDDGKSEFASLVWLQARVVVLDEGGADDFQEAFGDAWRHAEGWRIFAVGHCTAQDVIDALKGE